MHIIGMTSTEVDILWHLPEVEWHDATVELRSGVTPTGATVVRWHIDPAYDGEVFRPGWSSGRGRRLKRRARIRVPRHDGPCVVAVRIVDEAGGHVVTQFSSTRR
ncbi:hypothetical protein [Subtercola sp. YIM 133946]|uniref:hypothetical protein n=1 Tax=Subtercola sp. YIM 133946 TaxID=3118909 RepID=UPI002F93C53A